MSIDYAILKDNYSPKDTFHPRGLVVLSDEHGNIIFKKENMIVKSGRKMLISKKLDITADSNPFTGIIFSSNTNMVDPDDNVSTLKTNYDYATLSFNNNDATLVFNENGSAYDKRPKTPICEYAFDNDTLTATIEFKLWPCDDEEPHLISSLGLYYTDNDEDKLFSRVVFPTYTLSSRVKYIQFTYYLYF